MIYTYTHTHTHTRQDLWLDLKSNRLAPLPRFDAEGPHREQSATRCSSWVTDTRSSETGASHASSSSWAADALDVASIFDALGLPQEGGVRLG